MYDFNNVGLFKEEAGEKLNCKGEKLQYLKAFNKINYRVNDKE